MFLDGSSSAYHGWEKLTVTKSLESVCNSFSFQIPQNNQGESFELPAGTKVVIEVNGKKVITGRIEQVNITLAHSTKAVIISGRSLAGDLVDCSVETPKTYNNILISSLAQELIAPFGLRVLLSVVPGLIQKVVVKPGDTIFEVLDRQAMLQGFMWVSTRSGNIRLTEAGKFRATSAIHEDVNMKAGSIVIDESQRYAKYIVKGQSPGNDSYAGLLANSAFGSATDSGVRSERVLVLVSEGVADFAIARKRAQWEAASRIARTIRIQVTVQNWQQEDKSLWGVNQLIKLKSDTLGIDGDFLSIDVTHVRSTESGTVTKIGLTRADAYKTKPNFSDGDGKLNTLEKILAAGKRDR